MIIHGSINNIKCWFCWIFPIIIPPYSLFITFCNDMCLFTTSHTSWTDQILYIIIFHIEILPKNISWVNCTYRSEIGEEIQEMPKLLFFSYRPWKIRLEKYQPCKIFVVSNIRRLNVERWILMFYSFIFSPSSTSIQYGKT